MAQLVQGVEDVGAGFHRQGAVPLQYGARGDVVGATAQQVGGNLAQLEQGV